MKMETEPALRIIVEKLPWKMEANLKAASRDTENGSTKNALCFCLFVLTKGEHKIKHRC